jgi:hypothetical protein
MQGGLCGEDGVLVYLLFWWFFYVLQIRLLSCRGFLTPLLITCLADAYQLSDNTLRLAQKKPTHGGCVSCAQELPLAAARDYC